MIKIFSSILLSLLIFTGCSNFNTPEPLNKTKDAKQKLINSADNGNIEALIELNKTYLFPETKEGLRLFNKWYPLYIKSKNAKDILSYAKIFIKYKNMFINGDKRYIDLLNRVVDLGSKKDLFTVLDDYSYRNKKILFTKILNNPTQEDVNKLYQFYTKIGLSEKINELEKIIAEKGYKLSTLTKYYIIKSIYYNKNKAEKRDILFDEILKSKDKEAIVKTAKLLEYKDPKKALLFVRKAIEVDDKDSKLYTLYKNTYLKIKENRKDKDTTAKYLKKAALLDNYNATLELLKIYSSDIKYLDQYLFIKKKILDMFEAKRALADFYYKNGKKTLANNLLDELANKNNIKAMITLAKRSKGKYTYIPEQLKLAKKWQDFILNSNNPYLVNKLKKSIYAYNKSLKALKEKLVQKEVEDENILTLRSLYQKYRRRDPELSQKYVYQAIDAGDTFTSFYLAKKYVNSKNKDQVKKAIEIYKKLGNLGDFKAYSLLAKLYRKPPAKVNGIKNLEKAVFYYEKAIELGDTNAIYKVAKIYLCAECNKKANKIIDYKKVKNYAKKLAKLGKSTNINSLAWEYYADKVIKKDLPKAIELFKIAAEAGHLNSYYNLVWIYYKDYKDYKTALKYAKIGTNLKNANCISFLGTMYELGHGTPVDINKALQNYKKAYKYGENYSAPYNIGLVYQYGKKGLKQDLDEAIKWFKRSTLPESKKAIGAIYVEKGIRAEKKKKMNTAIKFYTKAFDLYKDPYAAYNIGLIYQYGKGDIKIDIKKARKWYKLSTFKKARVQEKILKENKEKK